MKAGALLLLSLISSTGAFAAPSADVSRALGQAQRRTGLSDAQVALYAEKISAYLDSLHLASAEERKEALARLLDSSTQFLLCGAEDWECLEQRPTLRPKAEWRQEARDDLGRRVNAGPSLQMDTFFTRKWDPRDPGDLPSVADRLAEQIRSRGGASVAAALYGIDDIQGTLSGVYGALTERLRARGKQTRAVFDLAKTTLTLFDRARQGGRPFVFSYVEPERGLGDWMLGERAPTDELFEYEDTLQLMRAMNEGIRSHGESRARLEWRTDGIMHQKFLVLGAPGARQAVWTGTANLSKECMGAEKNSNMSLLIRNGLVASAFQAEFDEMFEFNTEEPWADTRERLVNHDGDSGIAFGRFHTNKRPNTQRHFGFGDGTELRVHFSPTDDGEHRSILPMLRSAQSGDEIRVAMFGSSGVETVRAMQLAASRGAKIRVLIDRVTGAVPESWITSRTASLLAENPYDSRASIEVRISTWSGMNHLKTATLTRKPARRGAQARAEVLLVGSQNWSDPGNDLNDENLVSIRNKQRGVRAAAEFNQYFDERLWPNGRAAELRQRAN